MSPQKSFVLCACAMLALAIAALGPGPAPGFGDPLPGLSAAELTRFQFGREAFEEEEFAADGLGPVFTENACGKCHATPALGGGSTIVETRIGRRVRGRFDPLLEFGGPIIQNRALNASVGYNGAYAFSGETIPRQASIRAGRRSTPLFGLGLVNAVPDEAFLRIARLQSIHTPKTAGRPHIVTNLLTNRPAVGRFGWKAQIATLFDFSGDAYTNEMGITTPLVPQENCPQGDCADLEGNPLPNDIPNEPDNEDLVLFTDFMQFLGPPPARALTSEARTGARIFFSLGCASCHIPTLRTGPNASPALSHVTFHPYSDFLLHDMGSLGDGIEQGIASGREMRTAPLWGVSRQSTFLHDGRALTLEAAILAHDGQAKQARRSYSALNFRANRALIAFLKSL